MDLLLSEDSRGNCGQQYGKYNNNRRFQLIVTSTLDRNSNQLNSIDITASQAWTEVMESCGLLDSLRLTSPKRRIYTYCHTDNRARSRIDRMYVDVDISARVEASNFEISCFSDHKILKTRIGNNIERGPGSWVYI